jgi:DNA-binding winged helix-turn-helix (wHTH) protein
MAKRAPQTYSFNGFTLDPARACLLREGREVKLRPKSFEALKYLVENPGRVITKDELLQVLWPDSFVTDDSLVQCLRDVRRALGDEQQRYVKTVPRRGYIFDAEVHRASAVYAEQIESVRVVIDEETVAPGQSGEGYAVCPGAARRASRLLRARVWWLWWQSRWGFTVS